MHSFPCQENEDAFYLTGQAGLVEHDEIRDRLAKQFVDERSEFGVPPPDVADALFEFDIMSCLLTTTSGHGDPNPQHLIWNAGSAAG